MIEGDDSVSEKDSSSKECTQAQGPSNDQLASFFEELSLCGTKPVILSPVPPYDESYVSKTLKENVPTLLRDMYYPNLVNLQISDLRKYCSGV